jgi:hypothetical protein
MKCFWAAVFAMVLATPVFAFHIQEGDISVDVDTTVSYSTAMRMDHPDSLLLSNINGDDGDRNFKRYDLVTDRLYGITDIDAHYDKFGVFLRPRAMYDFAYDGKNANNSPTTNNNLNKYGGTLDATDLFTSQTTHLFDRVEMLDSFVYGSGQVAGLNVSGRVGRQVISWGESLFIQGGISSAQAPIDLTQAYAPGVQLRDIFLPTGAAQGTVTLTKDISLTGYYKWEWSPDRLIPTGSFYSTSDYLTGPNYLVPVALKDYLAATIDHTSDTSARSGRDFGVGVHYIAEWLNSTDFGFYGMNYSATLPMLLSSYSGGSMSPAMKALGGNWSNLLGPIYGPIYNALDLSSYHLAYANDTKLFGFSAGTVIYGANVGYEISYRDGMPMPYKDVSNPFQTSYERGDYVQTQLSIVDTFPKTRFYDQLTVTAEGGMGYAESISHPHPLYDTLSGGFETQIAFDWYSISPRVLPGVDLHVPLTWLCNPAGTSPLDSFVFKNDSASFETDWIYLQNFTVALGYAIYLNSPKYDPLADRSYLYCNIKYTF